MFPRSTKIAITLGVVAVALALVVPETQSAGPQFFSTTKTFTGSRCPSGWKLTGGGAGPLPSDSYSSFSSIEYTLTGSYPSAFGWQATGTVTRGSFSSASGWRFSTSSYTPKVYVVCAR
jgi:hypothetical protein